MDYGGPLLEDKVVRRHSWWLERVKKLSWIVNSLVDVKYCVYRLVGCLHSGQLAEHVSVDEVDRLILGGKDGTLTKPF